MSSLPVAAVPFLTGLSWPLEVLFLVCLTIVAVMLLWSMLLFVRAYALMLNPPEVPADGADGFAWVFLVPALNEEVTIADSVERLRTISLQRKRILVIDDGSDDRTPEILAAIDDPDLVVLRRDPPNARTGKAAALNDAYRSLADIADREHTIVVVVDADGRLDPEAPGFAAAHFVDEKVGGVQSLVRIYNRRRLLTWLQDLEFSVYGYMFQAGRNSWGTAGMGGNGQFNRLSALDQLSDGSGPWHHCLTEDQDLGLRLIAAGWHGHQDLRARVDQQGLSRLRPLYRQRTRWSQGNLQAMSLRNQVMTAPVSPWARVEQLVYMHIPVLQGVIGVCLLVDVVLWLTGTIPFWGHGHIWEVAVFYVLAFGGTIFGCVAARSRLGPVGWIWGFLLGHLYTIYTWMIWPVLVRAAIRQLSAQRDWQKTEREPVRLEPSTDAPALGAAEHAKVSS